MRLFLAVAAPLLALAGCAGAPEDVLPVAASVKGASFVRGTEVIVRQGAAAAVTALDERATRKAGQAGDYAEMPFAAMLSRAIEDTTRASGLTAGRALKLVVEVDSLKIPDPGAAFFGAGDQLAGSVFIRDAETGEPLGQLYLDVGGPHAGVLGILTRGGGVRERLAEAFAARIAKALGGRKP